MHDHLSPINTTVANSEEVSARESKKNVFKQELIMKLNTLKAFIIDRIAYCVEDRVREVEQCNFS